jgi:hypothetical protein
VPEPKTGWMDGWMDGSRLACSGRPSAAALQEGAKGCFGPAVRRKGDGLQADEPVYPPEYDLFPGGRVRRVAIARELRREQFAKSWQDPRWTCLAKPGILLLSLGAASSPVAAPWC